MFTRTFALPSGPRVGLRLAMPRDAARVARLLADQGVQASELEVRRMLTYDPSRRRVALAFAPVEGREVLVGVAGIDLDPGADVDTLVIDESLTGGLGEFLVGVMRDRAARARRVA